MTNEMLLKREKPIPPTMPVRYISRFNTPASTAKLVNPIAENLPNWSKNAIHFPKKYPSWTPNSHRIGIVTISQAYQRIAHAMMPAIRPVITAKMTSRFERSFIPLEVV